MCNQSNNNKTDAMPTNFFQNLTAEKKIVFIVEDNEVYSKMLQSFIQNRFPGTEVKIFRIGEVCLIEMEMERNPTIVIVDYFLDSKYPDALNGLEIIKRIKAIKPESKIIALSTLKNNDIVVETIKKQDCKYIQ